MCFADVLNTNSTPRDETQRGGGPSPEGPGKLPRPPRDGGRARGGHVSLMDAAGQGQGTKKRGPWLDQAALSSPGVLWTEKSPGRRPGAPAADEGLESELGLLATAGRPRASRDLDPRNANRDQSRGGWPLPWQHTAPFTRPTRVGSGLSRGGHPGTAGSAASQVRVPGSSGQLPVLRGRRVGGAALGEEAEESRGTQPVPAPAPHSWAILRPSLALQSHSPRTWAAGSLVCCPPCAPGEEGPTELRTQEEPGPWEQHVRGLWMPHRASAAAPGSPRRTGLCPCPAGPPFSPVCTWVASPDLLIPFFKEIVTVS